MTTGSATAIVIPARYGSTRFPGKPLATIAGRSLIQRVVEQARLCRAAQSVWVATDDDRIASHVAAFGGRVVMTEASLPTGTDRIVAALPAIEQSLGYRLDMVVNLQGDEPLIDTESVDRMIQELARGVADVTTLACPLDDPSELREPDVVKVVTAFDGRALYFSRAPIPWEDALLARRHIGIYGYTRESILNFGSLEPSPLERAERLEQLRLLQNGYTIRVLDALRPSPGVDRPDDVQKIERILAQRA